MDVSVGTEDRIERLLSQLQAGVKPELDEEVQRELAKLVTLLPQLKIIDDATLLGSAEVAASALLAERPNLELAQAIEHALAGRARRANNPLFRFWRRHTAPTRVVLGLATLVFVGMPIGLLFSPLLIWRDFLFGIDATMVIPVAFAGAMGSVVSMLARVRDFAETPRDDDPYLLFLTGLFKPVIGVGAALFVFVVLSVLLPGTAETERARYLFAAVAFLAGFTERIAHDVTHPPTRPIGAKLLRRDVT